MCTFTVFYVQPPVIFAKGVEMHPPCQVSTGCRFMANPHPVVVNMNTILTCVVTAESLANFLEIVRIRSDGDRKVVANVSNSMDDRTFQGTYLFSTVRFPRDDGAIFECRSSNANGPEAVRITITVQGEFYIE